jgi:hypothetical protein
MSNNDMVLEAIRQISSKIDKLDDKVDSVKTEQLRQGSQIDRNSDDLADHIRRTNLLEQRVDTHEDRLRPLTVTQLCTRIVAIVGGLGVIASTAYYAMRVFNIIK